MTRNSAKDLGVSDFLCTFAFEEHKNIYDMAAIEDRYISLLTDRPAALRDKIFDRLFQVAEIAKFTPTELREYEDSLKAYRDLKNSLDTAEEKGEAKEKKSTIKRLLASGISVDIIAIATGLTHDEVKVLIDDISKE